MGKRARAAQADPDTSDEEAAGAAQRLREWQDSADDASSAEEEQQGADRTQLRRQIYLKREDSVLQRGRVIDAAPIRRIIMEKGAPRAVALGVDLGDGVEGFCRVSDLVDPSWREAFAERLGTYTLRRDGRPTPLRLLRVQAKQGGAHEDQVMMGGQLQRIAECFDENYPKLPANVRKVLSWLHSRDRLCQFTGCTGLLLGVRMAGIVRDREREGLVLTLTESEDMRKAREQSGKKAHHWRLAPPPARLTGVAVGRNALLPGQAGTAGVAASDGSQLQCRVLDYDPVSMVADVTCNPAIVRADATDRRHLNRVLNKIEVGAEAKCVVLLRKAEYSVVALPAHSGALGYLIDAEGQTRRSSVAAGAEVQGRVEYIRRRPLPLRHARAIQRWKMQQRQAQQRGRAMAEDSDEDGGGDSEGSARPQEAEKPPEPEKQRAYRAPPLPDPWILPEPFIVLSMLSAKQDAAQSPAAPAVAAPAAAAPAAAAGEAAPDAAAPAKPEKRKRHAIELPFEWVADGSDDDRERPSTPDGAGEPAAKKKKKRRREAGRELAADAQERARVDESAGPSTVEDFERMVIATPHSSYVWCQFMAFYVAQREYERARNIAERALKTIDVRESQEHHNIWAAYLNLENLHGTQESTNEVFKRFEQRSDDKLKAYMTLADIGRASGRYPIVYKTFQTMIRKFGGLTIEPWVAFAKFLLERGNQEDLARMQKKMLSNQEGGLPDKLKMQALIKVGCLQFREGSIDRGRTIFDGLVLKYPKRVDVWSVYLDMELVVLPRLNDLTRIRSVFDRVTSLNLSQKKMQYFLTRYAAFEREHGDQSRQEYVKQRAIAFVNQKLGVDAPGGGP